MAEEDIRQEDPKDAGENENQASSLWDAGEENAQQTAEETIPQASETQPENAAWYFADGIQGEGEKPKWLKDKYKTVAEQAKAYTELEKKMGEFKGAPKDGYDLEAMELSKDDPLVNHFAETFKELNLSQQGFERVINDFYQVQKDLANKNIEEEIKKLGPNAKQEITQLNNWIGNTFDEKTAKTIKNWVETAEDMKALQTLKAFQPKSAIPSEADMNQAATFETSQTVKNEMHNQWSKYKEDANYRQSVQQRLANALRREKQQKR